MGIGPLICAASTIWLRFLSPGFSYWLELLPALLIFSAGLSMVVAPLTATVLADAGPGDAGIASGVNNAVARVASLLGIAVVGAAIAGAFQPARSAGLPDGHGDHGRAVVLGGATGLAGIRKASPRARSQRPRHERCRRDRLRPRHQALRRP
jgi:MFS family permease